MQAPAAPPRRIALITGGNQGLGYACARSIASRTDWGVVIACRNAQAAAEAVKSLQKETRNSHVSSVQLDLASLKSVRQFAAEMRAAVLEQRRIPPVAALVLNAGVQMQKAATTQEGIEMTFGVNHLGHFALLHLLAPLLAKDARVVFVSSGTHDPKQRTGMPAPVYSSARDLAKPWASEASNAEELGRVAYTTSKLCNVLAAYEFQRRFSASGAGLYGGVQVCAFDPGLMAGTGLARNYSAPLRFAWNYVLPLARPFMPNSHSTSTSGSALAALACDATHAACGGKYFNPRVGELRSSETSYEAAKAKDLWDTSVELAALPASWLCEPAV